MCPILEYINRLSFLIHRYTKLETPVESLEKLGILVTLGKLGVDRYVEVLLLLLRKSQSTFVCRRK